MNTSVCEYRGISLLSIVNKVYVRIVSDCVKRIRESLVTEGLGGFKRGRGCVGEIFVLRQAVKKVLEKTERVNAARID